jgi:hypothetical protein
MVLVVAAVNAFHGHVLGARGVHPVSHRQVCATKKQTKNPKPNGSTAATSVQRRLPDSL